MLQRVFILSIILIYVLIRLPTFPQPFGAELHGDKYATYLPTVLNMYREQNPFLNRNPNYISILNHGSNYSFKEFKTAPMAAWMLLPFMPMTGFLSLEQTIRWAQTFYGISLLSLIYLVLKRIVGDPIALFTTFLISVNPIFQLVTMITTRDLPALIFLFGAILLWQKQKRELTYLLAGFSILSKYSFLFITLPLFSILILIQEKDKTYHLLKLALLSFTPLLFFKVLLARTPAVSFLLALVQFFLFLVVIVLIYRMSQKFHSDIRRIFYKICPMLKFMIVTIAGVLSLTILKKEIAHFTPEFLTDRYLIFNLPMYKEILRQAADLTGLYNLHYYLLVIVLSLIVSLNKQRSSILIALLAGTISYLILASKSIFVHFYYRHLFILLFFFSLAILIKSWSQILRNQVPLWLVLITLTTILAPSQIKQIEGYFQVNKIPTSINQVGNYLDQTLKPGEKALGGEILNVYTQRTVIDPTAVTVQESRILREISQKESLQEALHRYQVKLYVTRHQGDFGALTNLTKLTEPVVDSRTEEILQRLGQVEIKVTEEIPARLEKTPLEVKALDGWYIYQLYE